MGHLRDDRCVYSGIALFPGAAEKRKEEEFRREGVSEQGRKAKIPSLSLLTSAPVLLIIENIPR